MGDRQQDERALGAPVGTVARLRSRCLHTESHCAAASASSTSVAALTCALTGSPRMRRVTWYNAMTPQGTMPVAAPALRAPSPERPGAVERSCTHSSRTASAASA